MNKSFYGTMKYLQYIKVWLALGILLITFMIVIGGITRLTGSGLSMVEWRIISGTIPPLTDNEWGIAFNKYKQFPEFKKLHSSMELWQFKRIFWWEYIHRLLGRVIGIVFIIPFLFFFYRKWLSSFLLKRLLLIFTLGALQGVMGWLMVLSGLQDQPHVSHFRLAAHLALGLLLIAIILWTILQLQTQKGVNINKRKTEMAFPYFCLVLLFVQIVLGAFVAGLKAGFSYNNFPWMGETFLPSRSVMATQPLMSNGVLFQFIHRWVAFIVLLVFFRLYRISFSYPAIKRDSLFLLCFVLSQVIIGVLTLIFQVPVALGVIHQFIAVIIFMLTITIIFKLKTGEIEVEKKVWESVSSEVL